MQEITVGVKVREIDTGKIFEVTMDTDGYFKVASWKVDKWGRGWRSGRQLVELVDVPIVQSWRIRCDTLL